MVVVRLENYIENLVRVTVEYDGEMPPSVVIWPKLYKPALEACSGAWELSPGMVVPQVEHATRAHVIVVKVRSWGSADHEWQACVTAGGVVSVLTNTNADRSRPQENETYTLTMT